MAATLGIEVMDMDLGFLTEAYEEIAECRRRIRWVHAYGYYYLDPEAEGDRNNKRELFDRLLQEAMDSLERLVVCDDHERSMLCATEVEAITETYSASKKKVVDLTRETRQHFEKLMKAAETDFQY
jgi:ariadne-1